MNEALQVLLRHNRTGYYYRNRSEWVLAPSDAKGFADAEQAKEVLGKEGLDGLTPVPRPADCRPEWVFTLNQSALHR